jgi:hypothetical protein
MLVLAAVAGAPAGAATFKLDCAKRSLQAKVNAVPAGSTILVKGTCDPITVDKSLTLDGNPSATIDADGVGRPLTIDGTPTIRLLDLRLTGGNVAGTVALGGAILHPGGALTLRRVVVFGNRAEGSGMPAASAFGGGIYSQGGPIRIFSSTIRDNVVRSLGGSAGAGGGGIAKTGELLLENTRVTGNRARAESTTTVANAYGGGIVAGGAPLTIRASHVDRNRSTAVGTGAATAATGVGAGIELSTPMGVTIAGSTVSGNHAVSSLVGGSALAEGGGLHGAVSGTAVVRDSVLAENQARSSSPAGATVSGNGGGGYLEAPGGLTFLRTRVTGSLVSATSAGTATAAGGGLALAEGPYTLRRSRIAGNELDATGGTGLATARGGGLMLTSTANVLVRESTVHGNRADSAGPGGSTSTGGGIGVANAVLRLRASTVSKNVAATAGQALGGGLFLESGGPHVVENSTIAGNRVNGATARGGGIDPATTLTVTSATIARNSAKIGGGIYVESGTTTVEATILALNTAPDGPNCSQNVASAGRNLVATALGCAFAAAGTDKVAVLGPGIGFLGGHGGPTATIPLRKGSPAVNAIPRAECAFGRDQRGVRRPRQKRCDIGAYERRP